MKINDFKKIIELYKSVENDVMELDDRFGIRIWDNMENNFYNNLHMIIHSLFESMFGEKNTMLLEDFLFDQTDISFEELCKVLNIQ